MLTALRLLLVPVVVRELWLGDFRRALYWLLLAGFTDALDGFLARRLHSESRLGAYLDPVGDKLLLVSVYLALGWKEVVPRWLMWLVLGKDALILVMVVIAFAFTPVRSFPPTVWGKLSTTVQVVGALVVISGNAFFESGYRAMAPAVIYVIAGVTGWTALHYAWLGITRFPAARRGELPN